ncbi:uncharacterized protein LTR77_008877 [Saxophila tyrrhenica]|uniref:Uncharacterized protein n=1 Tax=Saxophila tyrrhenica TaxID=1690608 RepID=A0AAV9P0H4_9PEZI|nr:hypothetical protein LTR77_008877 [Saxophila tyrrhenica]
MVATRNHPKEFPDPETAQATAQESPRKRTTRTSTANNASPTKAVFQPQTPARPRAPTLSRTPPQLGWSHTPSNFTLLWLAISLPLVIWDTGYVLLRPLSMPGGSLSKIWYPYGMYGTVDYVYGFKAYNAHEGWTAAQGISNAFETAAYMVYLYMVYEYGEQEPRQGSGAPDKSAMGQLRALSESRTVTGRVAAFATLLGFGTALVTCFKTVLYWVIEACAGFANIGHNDWATLILFWGPMNFAWIVVPGYLVYVFGKEILDGLESATQSKKSR